MYTLLLCFISAIGGACLALWATDGGSPVEVLAKLWNKLKTLWERTRASKKS